MPLTDRAEIPTKDLQGSNPAPSAGPANAVEASSPAAPNRFDSKSATAYKKYIETVTTPITQQSHPALFEAYQRYCARNHIEFPPKLRLYKMDMGLGSLASSWDNTGMITVSKEFMDFPLNEQLAILAHETGHAIARQLNRQDLPIEERAADYFAVRTLGERENFIASLERINTLVLPWIQLQEELTSPQQRKSQDRTGHGTHEDRVMALRNVDINNRSYEDGLIERYNQIQKLKAALPPDIPTSALAPTPSEPSKGKPGTLITAQQPQARSLADQPVIQL